jgi:hypothetical protein
MRTNLGFFNIVQKPELFTSTGDSEEEEDDDLIDYEAPSYMQIRHDRQQTRSTSNMLYHRV